jgi:hypothetical protein
LPFSRLPGAKRDSRGRIVIRVTDLDKLLIATRVDVAGKDARPARPRRKPGKAAADWRREGEASSVVVS